MGYMPLVPVKLLTSVIAGAATTGSEAAITNTALPTKGNAIAEKFLVLRMGRHLVLRWHY